MRKKEVVFLKHKFKEPLLNLVWDTLKNNKQALVFVNTKQRAEKTADIITDAFKNTNDELSKISDSVLTVLSKPTKQCKRLARVVKYGVAFHHSGLISKQREIIEDEFRKGNIRVICCTPTLAYGLNLPAFRVIIRDLKRYTYNGYAWIPVLEAQQMFGRAGRPKYDNEGQAICIVPTESDKETVKNRYIDGYPENIYSKLAVEPVFRTYLLSLISTNIVRTKEGLIDFFSKTFWAHQFRDMNKIEFMIDNLLRLLSEWKFIIKKEEESDFMPAEAFGKNNSEIKPTKIGRRIAELYLDPLTAHNLIVGLSSKKKKSFFSIVNLCTKTLEMRPYLRVSVREFEDYEQKLVEFEDEILGNIPKPYDEEYDDFLSSFKTSMLFYDWANEEDEESLLEKYNVRPGELKAKLQRLDWVIYASHEIAQIFGLKNELELINKTRLRLKYGVKEELLNLLRLKNIGRVRARKLFNNNIQTIGDLRKKDEKELAVLLGEKTAKNIKEQLNQEHNENKRDAFARFKK